MTDPRIEAVEDVLRDHDGPKHRAPPYAVTASAVLAAADAAASRSYTGALTPTGEAIAQAIWPHDVPMAARFMDAAYKAGWILTPVKPTANAAPPHVEPSAAESDVRATYWWITNQLTARMLELARAMQGAIDDGDDTQTEVFGRKLAALVIETFGEKK